jgi:hypothetical protein
MREFDPDSDFEKHRDINGNIHFVQNGHAFTQSHEHIGKVTKPTAKPASPKVQTPEQKSAKDRASEKLKGFKEPELPGGVKSPLAENQAAKAAEDAHG